MEKFLESLKKTTPSRDSAKALPESPGVYIFLKNDKPIYVGKAINLKSRVTSYFDLDLEPKTAKMVSEATEIRFLRVDSDLEALLLEAKLIRKFMPHFNIAAKDDKHPLYIVITKEKYPRIVTVRKIDLNKGSTLAVYGPFPSSRAVFGVLKMIRRIFPNSDHKIGKRPCLYSHIGLCNPCPNQIEMLNDKFQILNLRKKYLKNIKNIKSILDGKSLLVRKRLEIEMKGFSKQQKYEAAAETRNQIDKLDYITSPQMPVDSYMENPNLYSDQRDLEIKKLKGLIKNLKFKIENLSRIECFDIAHLAGSSPTASMVTFVNGEADKTLYRNFKIKRATGGDDYGSMREVAKRRQNNFYSWGRPDLIIVDGGVGQVKAFSENISEIPVVGIAKHPDRLIVGNEKIKLEGPALNLVSRMRDEAHRFARRYHHKLISKSLTENN